MEALLELLEEFNAKGGSGYGYGYGSSPVKVSWSWGDANGSEVQSITFHPWALRASSLKLSDEGTLLPPIGSYSQLSIVRIELNCLKPVKIGDSVLNQL